MIDKIILNVTDAHVGERLDKFISFQEGDLTRSHIQKLILDGHISVNAKQQTVRKTKVEQGDVIEIIIPIAQEANPEPENIPLDVVYEDEHLIVVNKAAGMVVHPAQGNYTGTLVNALLYHCGDSLSGIRGVKMPGIVHRLDKDTSGLIIVAKSDNAHQGLASQFQDKSLFREYKALVFNTPNPISGEIAGNIGRDPKNRQKMAILEHGGKEALTSYETLKTFGTSAALVKCRLHSGRTHQIRVHMTSIRCPLFGDPLYGRSAKWLQSQDARPLKEYLMANPQQALHAYKLNFIHPISSKEISLSVDVPAHFDSIMSFLS